MDCSKNLFKENVSCILERVIENKESMVILSAQYNVPLNWAEHVLMKYIMSLPKSNIDYYISNLCKIHKCANIEILRIAYGVATSFYTKKELCKIWKISEKIYDNACTYIVASSHLRELLVKYNLPDNMQRDKSVNFTRKTFIRNSNFVRQ